MSSQAAWASALAAYGEWRDEASRQDGLVELNAYFAAIAALGHLQESFPVERSRLITANNQVAGIQRYVRSAMALHSENRRLPTELGRTTRSTVGRAVSLTDRMNSIHELSELEPDQRAAIFAAIEKVVVLEIQKYLDQVAILVHIDALLPGPVIVGEILKAAITLRYGGPVAQHLVGAKLAIRFPDQTIENHPFTAADQQTGRRGDFQIGPSVFHVTVGEQPGHFEKCIENLRQGLKVYLLVPESRMNVVKTYFEDYGLTGKAAAQSIESFVGQNMDELGEFQSNGIRHSFAALLREYNRRVTISESNRGLMIEIPDNLK